MLERLFPKQVGNDFDGQRLALWLLGLLLALKLVMSVNSIANSAAVATGADGLKLGEYGPGGARAVLMLFEMVALGQLALALVGVLALLRYRAMVPLVFLLLAGEHVARRMIASAHAAPGAQATSVGLYINLGILAVLVLGLALSLWPRSPHRAAELVGNAP